jgi:small-conductance mechanosensitive channel
MDNIDLSFLSTIFSLEQFTRLASILLIALVLHLISRKIIKFVIYRSRSASKPATSHEDKQRKDTLVSIAHTSFILVLWVSVFLLILGVFGVSVGPLLAGAGVAGVALGFGAQTMVKDFLAGIFIIGENQYRIGDVIRINQTISGRVESLSLRMTSLRDLEGKVHYIPNGTIEVATNMTMEYANIELNIGVGLHTDIDQVEQIIEKVGLDMQNDPDLSKSIIDPPHMLRLDAFTDSGLVIKIMCKTQPGDQWSIKGQFLRRLKKAFEKANVETSLPQVVVHQPSHHKDRKPS